MDAATLLEHYTHDLANMPQETQYMLHELQKKDLEYDKILSEIQSADSQLFKYIKQHGSIIRHPKEELLTEEIRKNLDQARKIQNEKVLLANTALLSIAKHAAKFERDIKKLVDSGAIENWDVTENDIEMIDVNMNSTAVPISIGSPSSFSAGTPPVSGDRTTGDVTELTAKFNHSSLDTKIQRPPKKSSRGMTPTSVSSMDDTTLSTKQSAHTRRRDVTAGTIIKGPNRRVIGAVKGLGGNGNSGAGEDDELYCFCQQVSYGAMVACDNPNCKYEWFHYECVGLKEPPVGVWFCPDCRKGVKKDPKKEEKKKL